MRWFASGKASPGQTASSSHAGNAAGRAARLLRAQARRGCAGRIWRSRRGATSLEFAIISVVLLTLLLGAVEIARYMFTLEALRTAAAEAARAVTLRGSANMNAGLAPCSGLSGDLTGVEVSAPFLNPGALSLTMSGCATNAGVTTVAVTVSHPFGFVLPFFGSPPATMTETAQAVFN